MSARMRVARPILALCVLGLVAACSKTSVAQIMDAYLWEKRVLLIFTPSKDNNEYKGQLLRMEHHLKDMVERDVVIWQIVRNESVIVDGEKKAQLGTPPFYDYFHVNEDHYTVILINKDGNELLRMHKLVKFRDINALIDELPPLNTGP